MNDDKPRKASATPGFAIIGLALTGVSGIVAGFLSTSVGSGLALLASAVSFGIMLHIAYK